MKWFKQQLNMEAKSRAYKSHVPLSYSGYHAIFSSLETKYIEHSYLESAIHQKAAKQENRDLFNFLWLLKKINIKCCQARSWART